MKLISIFLIAICIIGCLPEKKPDPFYEKPKPGGYDFRGVPWGSEWAKLGDFTFDVKYWEPDLWEGMTNVRWHFDCTELQVLDRRSWNERIKFKDGKGEWHMLSECYKIKITKKGGE